MLRQAVLVGILSTLFFFFFRFYIKLGYNIHYKKHHPGDCRHVKGHNFGSEDFEVTADGLAFITSGLLLPPMSTHFKEFMKKNDVRGRIYLFDFKQPLQGARSLNIRASKDFDLDTFQPHGISLLEDKVKGNHLLYVINHPKGGKDRVEKFRYHPESEELEHVRFFNDSKFAITNDLALINEDKFYIGNYLVFESSILSPFEYLLPIGFGSLIFVDGDSSKEVISGLHGPNGVTLSKDKKFLYVAMPLDATLHVYERQADDSLKLVQDVVEVHSLLDNLQVTLDGDAIIAGAHPIFYKGVAHIDNPVVQAPSSALRLPLSNGRIIHEEITELFYDHGDLISGSSVAQVYDNYLLIGSVMNKLVVCEMYVRQEDSTDKS